jgi:hypothetical protein
VTTVAAPESSLAAFLAEECPCPICPICVTGGPGGGGYRPHTLAAGCWCAWALLGPLRYCWLAHEYRLNPADVGGTP